MGVVINPESEYGKELARWNKPWVYQAYPRMLYRAQKRPDGIYVAIESSDHFWQAPGPSGQLQPIAGAAESFSKTCQRIVQSEAEHGRARDEGWRDTPQEAMEHYAALEKAISDAAGHRHYEDRNMSEKAKAEAAAVDDASERHVPEIPRTPVKRRGRPPKVRQTVES